MPRRLPWATRDSPAVREKQPRLAPKKREASSSDDERVDSRSRKSSRSLKGTKKRASSRTPSTSPPLGPPDEEYMIEGYDHDDIYIMVEDEFHAVAQTFTQHLHHAEYQRLKKKARDAAPPTFKPTEAMRAEARKRMEAGALQARQKHALGNLTNGVNLSADEDEEQEDDPWLGTSLAGLMADAGNQKKTALVGLEKIQSSTRAAKGFGRGTGDSPANRKEKMNVSDIFGVSRKGEQDVHNSSENDSGRPTKAKSVPSKPRSHENPGSDEAGDVRGATSNAISTTSSMPESSSKRDATDSISRSRVREPSVAARRLFEDFDKFDNLDRPDKVTRKPRPSPSRKDRNSRPAKDNKLRLSDIPTFLV